MDADTRENLEKAYAKFIRDVNKTPEQAKSDPINIKMLLTNLTELDSRWREIPPDQMKTSAPRTLIHRMRQHLTRWKDKVADVQKTIDSLPDDHDCTENVDHPSNDSRTDSDNEQEEKKHEEPENPWKKFRCIILNKRYLVRKRKKKMRSDYQKDLTL